MSATFDEQVQVLVDRGHPGAAGLEEDAFRARLEPLRAQAPAGEPFVLVVGRGLVPASRAIELVRRRDRPGFSVLDAEDLARFVPLASAGVPEADAWLLTGVDTGEGSRNVTPTDALAAMQAAGRWPLTVEEGIALVTQDPEAVWPNAGFSLCASRCGDKRVCALWISKGAPKLGWCWAGNPHTWLGSASCAARLA